MLRCFFCKAFNILFFCKIQLFIVIVSKHVWTIFSESPYKILTSILLRMVKNELFHIIQINFNAVLQLAHGNLTTRNLQFCFWWAYKNMKCKIFKRAGYPRKIIQGEWSELYHILDRQPKLVAITNFAPFLTQGISNLSSSMSIWVLYIFKRKQQGNLLLSQKSSAGSRRALILSPDKGKSLPQTSLSASDTWNYCLSQLAQRHIWPHIAKSFCHPSAT